MNLMFDMHTRARTGIDNNFHNVHAQNDTCALIYFRMEDEIDDNDDDDDEMRRKKNHTVQNEIQI